MKPALQLRLSQQLTLTPQLKLAIRLLQLSSLELETEIRNALESNPVLEMEGDPAFEADSAEAEKASRDLRRESAAETTPSSDSTTSSSDRVDQPAENLPDNAETDDSWEMDLPSEPIGSASSHSGDDDYFEAQRSASEGLQEHLVWQLNLSRFSERDLAIALALVDALNDDGYLSVPLSDIEATLVPLPGLEADEIEAVLRRVQQLDPPGVGARDLAECLTLQLRTLDDAGPVQVLALKLTEHLELLARGDRTRLRKLFGCDDELLDQAIALIRTLNPKPGARLQADNTEYVKPDVYVAKRDGLWRVALNPDCRPRLAISQHYESMVGKVSRDDASYLRGHLQEARWLIKSLETRNETMLKVANSIVARQQDFLEQGPEAMRPMVLRDVAEEIGMHESTVSRVTTRKYMHTPRGIFEFKFFFSSHVGTHDGGTASATAIQALIRKLIEAEPANRPLSDSALTKQLNAQGIAVARRTVAKYREAMNIPSSTDRVRLA